MIGRDPAPPPAPSASPIARVASVAGTGGRLLVLADFDGTLSELVADPMAAAILPGARRALRRLAGIAARRPDRMTVAILTGRSSLDVAARVRVGGVRYLGNMGNEAGTLVRGGRPERLAVTPAPGIDADVIPATRLAEAVVAALSAGGPLPPSWLFVEHKGPAVAFHYRAAADRDEARRQLEAAFAAAEAVGLLEPFSRIEGRLLIDFQPVGAGAKGEATERLIEEVRPAAVIAFGDDRADAEAFRAIRSARSERRLRDDLAVAVRHPHPLPPEIEAAADVVLDGIPAVARVLARLARILEQEEASG